jgi:3-hydroxy-3-methylglutaryl CoA synthase
MSLVSLIYNLDNGSIGKKILLFSYGSGAMSSVFQMKIRELPNINRSLCDLLNETRLNKCNVKENPNNLQKGCYYLDHADNTGRFYKKM